MTTKYVPNIGTEIQLTMDFGVVCESLTRIGEITGNRFFQEHFILIKKDNPYLVTYKELRILDGERLTLNKNDENKVKSVANLLVNWEMIEIIDKTYFDNFEKVMISVLKSAEVHNYIFKPRYSFG